MIKLFSETDHIFSSNGDKIIRPKKAIIHKEDNGSFYLDIETDLSYVEDLVTNKILVCPTPQGEQAFRIINPEISKHKIKIRANHIFYDSNNYLIEDSYVVDKNCNDALDHLNNATSDLSPFTTLSDVPGINSYRCVRSSLFEAFNVVLERWGGHLVRDNYDVQIRSSIGQDNGVTIRYKKNLKDISSTENWDDVVTKLMPVGKDGLLLPEKYVFSTVQYQIPFTKKVSFEQNVNEDDYKDSEGNINEEAYEEALIIDLRNQAQIYVNNHYIPKINYTLKANLEKISDVGDTVEVIDERLDINIITHLISFDYDVILKKYIELEFGNFKKKLDNLRNDISTTVDYKVEESTNVLKVVLSDELAEANNKIWSVLGSSYGIFEGDKLLFVDTLPKEQATNVLMINSGGIGFSQSGINGPFKSAWTIDNKLNMDKINVIGLTADLIKGGTLKLGSSLNQNGILEVYDEANNLIAELNKNGLKMYGQDNSYIKINNEVGFAGYDRNDSKIYWVDRDEFHQKKSVIEEEVTMLNRFRYLPITTYDSNDQIDNVGMGLVPVGSDV